MKKMIRILLLLTLVLLLAGCREGGAAETEEPAIPSATTAAKTTAEPTEQAIPTEPETGIPIFPPETEPAEMQPSTTEPTADQPDATEPFTTESPAKEPGSLMEDELPFVPIA